MLEADGQLVPGLEGEGDPILADDGVVYQRAPLARLKATDRLGEDGFIGSLNAATP